MKLATWNVNSLKVRMPHLLSWLGSSQVDIVCLQETKTTDDSFPVQQLLDAGYRSHFTGQKTYNGVALLLREGHAGPASDLVFALPAFEDPQRRLIAATVNGLRVVCGYFPNGQTVDSDKYVYKLQWLAALTEWLGAELAAHEKLALVGDFNIAPEDRDVYDPVAWAGQVLCSEPERAAFRGLLALGLVDAFRLFEQPERSYTWWDYREMAFRRKMGLRIDHILLTPSLASSCAACDVAVDLRRLERPSDHAPVVATLSGT